MTIWVFVGVNVSTRWCLLTSVHMQGSNVMEDQDLRDIGITDPGHRKKILHAARGLPKVVNVSAEAER